MPNIHQLKRWWANTLAMHANARLNLSHVIAGCPVSPRKVRKEVVIAWIARIHRLLWPRSKTKGFAKDPCEYKGYSVFSHTIDMRDGNFNDSHLVTI